MSKPLAGLVSARLVCERRLDLDARATDLLPAYRPIDERAEHITVRQLLDHTSGIGPLVDQLDDDAPGRAMTAAVAAVAAERLTTGPGAAHAYSSANYLLLQGVLEEVTGEAYAELVTGELALRGARGVVDRATANTELVGGRHYVMGSAARLGDRYDDLGLAYGYLGGSVRDLAAVGASVAADLRPSGDGSAAEGSEVDAGRCATELATTPSSRPNEVTAYGLGWRVSMWHGEEVLWHAGAVDGYSSFLGVLPETGAVVVVLQDAYGPLHDATLLAPGVGAGAWAGALRWAPDVGALAVLAGIAGVVTAARGVVGVVVHRKP